MIAALLIRLIAIGELFDDLRPQDNVRLRGALHFDYPDYKLSETLRRRPQLLILGSSTVMQWRDELFSGCTSISGCFYNAGGAMVTLRDGLEFMRRLGKDTAPRVLLLGLNVWHLNPDADDPSHNKHVKTDISLGDPLRRLDFALGVSRGMIVNAAQDRELDALLIGRTPMPADERGVTAVLRGSGFRSDGSYDYGDAERERVSAQAPAERSELVRSQIQRSCCRFESFSHPDEVSLQELDDLLNVANALGTQVVAFIPPMSELVVRAMDAQPGLRDGVSRAKAGFAAEFAHRGVSFVDAGTPTDLGCVEEQMWDGIHPSEVCDARMLLRLLDGPAGTTLARYADRAEVLRLISGASTPLILRRGF